MPERASGARHRADVRPSTPFDPVLASAQGLTRKTAVVVASSGLMAAGAVPAFAADSPVANPSALTAPARSVLGAQSLASVPAAADWALDVPQVTVVAQPAKEAKVKNLAIANTAEQTEDAEPASEPEPAAPKPADPEPAKPKAKEAVATKAKAKASKSAKASKDKAAKAEKAATSSSVDGSAVLEIASRYIGVPYVYGGASPRGFDCSGFTKYVYAQLGISLPHQSESQRSYGRVVSRANARPGDLVWTPGHVAIYAGGNKMIDSARSGTTVQYRKMWQSNPVFIRLG